MKCWKEDLVTCCAVSGGPLSKVNKWSYLRRFKPSSHNIIVMYVNVSYSVNVRRPDSSVYFVVQFLKMFHFELLNLGTAKLKLVGPYLANWIRACRIFKSAHWTNLSEHVPDYVI